MGTHALKTEFACRRSNPRYRSNVIVALKNKSMMKGGAALARDLGKPLNGATTG